MADSSVPISGTAFNADTRTAPDGDHRQVVVIGDPTAANVGGVDSVGRLNVNVGGSGGLSPGASGNLTASALASITGTGNTTGSVVLDVSAAGNASFHLLATAFVGTIVFEQSFDSAGGSGTWFPVPVLPEDGTLPVTTLVINTAVAYIRQFTLPMFGPALFRIRCSAFTSGSIATLMRAGPGWYEGQPSLAEGNRNIGIVDLAAATTSTVTSVTLSGTANTNTVPVAADSTRKGLIIQNTSQSATVLLGIGTATTSTLYSYKLMPGQGVEIAAPFAKMAINAQSNVASSAIAVTAGVGV